MLGAGHRKHVPTLLSAAIAFGKAIYWAITMQIVAVVKSAPACEALHQTTHNGDSDFCVEDDKTI